MAKEQNEKNKKINHDFKIFAQQKNRDAGIGHRELCFD
jgi:hypothetical protein